MQANSRRLATQATGDRNRGIVKRDEVALGGICGAVGGRGYGLRPNPPYRLCPG
ncbi:hypothetical protein GCM10027514_31380 [Azotobacter armeniacus]